jgi:hypothetical protein
MTTSNLMSLPVDIAWKRLAFDSYMMRNVPRPPNPFVKTIRRDDTWHPTTAIFYAYPDPDNIPKEYEDYIITYLKVVCSLTGTTPLRRENLGNSLPPDHPAYNIVANNLTLYYGCYGALLQVTVAPYGDDADTIPFDEYPYFFDFEPKKRELYEDVTDSGEILSGSKEDLQVRKSATSSTGSEITTGNVIPSTQPPYKQDFHEEIQNIRNIDASREYRETASHSTKLSQLYHQLDSYYPGTNRALFFIQPRPHIANPKYLTFLNGPRQLEGIQEFFLVVIQPKSRPGLCVSAELSTGHLAFNKNEDQVIQPSVESKVVQLPYTATPGNQSADYSCYEDTQTFELGKDIWPAGLPNDESVQIWVDDSVNKNPIFWSDVKNDRPLSPMQGPGWTLTFNTDQSSVEVEALVRDEDGNPTGQKVKRDLIQDLIVTSSASGLKVLARLDQGAKIVGTLSVSLKVKQSGNIVVKGKETTDFFVRHNGVASCLDVDGKITPWYVEGSSSSAASVAFSDANLVVSNPWVMASGGKVGGMSRAVRDLNTAIGEAMRDLTLSDTGPWANLLHTKFALNLIRKGLSTVANRQWLQSRVQRLPRVSVALKERLLTKGIKTREQLLACSLEQLRDMLQLSNDAAKELYLNAWDLPPEAGDNRPRKTAKAQRPRVK